MANEGWKDSDAEMVVGNRNSRAGGLVLASILLILMGLVNLPYQYVEADGRWLNDEEGVRGHQRHQVLPTMAGWPVRYWIQYDRDGSLEERYWSASRLVLNLFIAVVACMLVYGYVQLRDRHTSAARDRRFTQTVFDLGIAMAILLVPGVVLAWEYRIAKQHQRMGANVGSRGNTYMSCWLPAPIADQVPSVLVQSLMRVREVHLSNPDHEFLQTISPIPTLVALHCYRGDFDSSAMEPLVGNCHFADLRFSGRSLRGSDLDLITRLRWLSQLHLPSTNLNGDMLRRLDSVSTLTLVDLSRTPLTLSELGTPQWSSTVEELYLPRQPDGVEASLDIDGWPRLHILGITRMSMLLNEARLEIRLSNLPKLESLRLDRVQKHGLTFHHVPRLAKIDEGISDFDRFIENEDRIRIPGLTWATHLDLDGVNSLESIGCFARDLEEISTQNVPNLRSIKMGSFSIGAFGFKRPERAEPERSRRCIQFLGDLQGPSKIDLTELPLGQIDLSPLTNNRRIRRLGLVNSGITFQHVAQLEGMEQLESLDLGECRLEEDQLAWVLEHFPNLEDLRFDGTGLSRFDPSNHERIEMIRTTKLENAKTVRIVDMPLLRTSIRMSRAPEHMKIHNAQSIRGLAVERHWPDGAEVSGLRDLDWFAGGGTAIDDALADVVLRCKKLDQLTLAYTSVTRDKLSGIGDLRKLSMLILPGAEVDDEITAKWHRLKHLWEVNFDDTDVSEGTLVWCSEMESLRRVSLNRVVLSDAAADALAELRQVSDLHLAGVSIDPMKLTPLLQGGELELLNLAGWDVDSSLADALTDVGKLKCLLLYECDVDLPSLQRILTSNPSLYVDVGIRPLGGDLPVHLRERVLQGRRSFRIPGRPIENEVQGRAALPEFAERIPADLSSLIRPYENGKIAHQVFRPRSDNDQVESYQPIGIGSGD